MVLSIFTVASITSVPPAKAAYDNTVTVFLQPGVPDPNNPGFSLTLGTLRNYPEMIASDVASQSTANNFAILSGSTGDFMFTFTVTQPIGYIRIYVDPAFTWPKPNNAASVKYDVWTDITNDYGYIAVGANGAFDGVAPNWNVVTIGRHAASFHGGFYTTASPMYTTLVIEPGVYHVRLLGLTAPNTVGVYHFKIATDAGFIPVADWPIAIVKGELNSAYVTGLVEAPGDRSGLSGMVTAVGTTADGRSITGIDMLSPEDECPLLADQCGGGHAGYYRYYIFGLPAGAYTVNATMSGGTVDTSSRFTVAAGQSYHLTSNLGPGTGPLVSVHVFSKHGRGTIPWCSLWQPPFGTNVANVCDDLSHPRDIEMVLKDSSGNQIGWWGSNFYGAWTALTGNFKDPTVPTATDYTMQLTDTRGLPSINWMTVPSDHADYVAGFSAGTNYSVETHVTGYVMTADDAYQRTFTVTSKGTAIEMDLRRSNWFDITVHELNNLYPTTLAVAAVPTGTGWPVTPGTESGLAAISVPPASTRGTNDAEIIMEGWAEGWPGALPTWDYGLAPGTYDIHMMAADQGLVNAQGVVEQVGNGIYNIQSGQPFTGSIALCNSPSALSFKVQPLELTLSLRSVDSEIPAHMRPWLFPGAEIWISFVDASGNVVASVDPTEYQWAYGLVQDNGHIGPFGHYDVDTVSPDNMHGLLKMTWAGFNPAPEDVVNVGWYPTMLPSGQYTFQVNTYGYTTARVYPVWVPVSGSGDIQADLIQGGMVRVNLDFKKQGETTNFNGFVRVEVYDSSNKLVGANIYGMAQPNYCDTSSSSPDTCTYTGGYAGSYLDYSAANDFKVVKGAAEGANTDPDGQRAYLSSLWYGVPSSTWAGWVKMDPSDANRLNYDGSASASFDVYGFYWYYGGPSSRNNGYWANGWETTDGTHQPDSGILGSRDTTLFKGGGLYTVKVFAFDPYGPDNTFGTSDDWQSYYADAVTNVEIPWSGATTIGITMNQMGRVSGTATWLDMYGDMSSVPWATVSAGSAFASTTTPIDPSWGFGYSEPSYYLWLPAGTQDVSIAASNASQVFAPATSTVVVSDGWSGTYDQTLIPTGVPVPEFPASMLLVMLSALGASVYLLRRKRTIN
jgi:hypothetical protein